MILAPNFFGDFWIWSKSKISMNIGETINSSRFSLQNILLRNFLFLFGAPKSGRCPNHDSCTVAFRRFSQNTVKWSKSKISADIGPKINSSRFSLQNILLRNYFFLFGAPKLGKCPNHDSCAELFFEIDDFSKIERNPPTTPDVPRNTSECTLVDQIAVLRLFRLPKP